MGDDDDDDDKRSHDHVDRVSYHADASAPEPNVGVPMWDAKAEDLSASRDQDLNRPMTDDFHRIPPVTSDEPRIPINVHHQILNLSQLTTERWQQPGNGAGLTSQEKL
jgi:hypothetical protein